MKKYYQLLLLLLALGGLTGCVIEDAERMEPTEGPYLAYKNVQAYGLDQPAYLVKEFLFADEYLSADESRRNEMVQNIFTHHNVAALDGMVCMKNSRTHENKIKYIPQNGLSLHEVGAEWERISDRDGSPKRVKLCCIGENTWQMQLCLEEYTSPYCELTIKTVPTDVKLAASPGPWDQQYEVLAGWGKLTKSENVWFSTYSGGFGTKQSVTLEFLVQDAFGLYYNGETTQAFDGSLAISYRSLGEPDVEFTATFGTWAQKNVCIRWLNHEKIWRQ